MLKLKRTLKPVLTGLIIIIRQKIIRQKIIRQNIIRQNIIRQNIIRQNKYLPFLWVIPLLTACLFFSSWSLAGPMPELLKKVDIVYYIYFFPYKKYNIHKSKNCRISSHDSGFHHLDHAVLQCRENISLLRPLHIIKSWQREQSKAGFLTLTVNEFGIKNVHGYIKEIKSAPSSLFSANGQNIKAGTVTGRFVRHVADVRNYQFKNRINR